MKGQMGKKNLARELQADQRLESMQNWKVMHAHPHPCMCAVRFCWLARF